MDENFLETPMRLINRAARLAQRQGEPMLAPLGLASAQLPVLAALKSAEPLTQKRLAQVIGIEQPTMAQLLARMERDGLVKRTPHAEDGRSSYVALTAAAREKLPAARRALIAGNAAATAGLSEREKAALMRLLRKVIANLEQA